MRSRVELALRLTGLAALVLWIVLAALPRVGRTASARVGGLSEQLQRWTTHDPVGAVHARLDTAPDARHRAWLAALRAAGVRVSWQGDVAPIAIEAYPAADPTGGTFVATSASGASALNDDLGPLDTLARGVSTIRLASVDGSLSLASGRQSARAAVRAGGAAKRVLVAGAAGWEPKFVIAALEENGWTVDARLVLGPGHEVDQGARAPLDTSRYAAVILLDSAAAEQTRGVEAFVRSGGGVVLSADANRAAAIQSLVAWRTEKHEAAPLGTPPADTTWRGLSRVALSPGSDRNAIPLERRGGEYGLAVRRHHAGRVAAVGYDQTWRWRMAGAGSSLAAHRDWWSRLVASVALRPVLSEAKDLQVGSAPLASVHAALGAPSEARSAIAAWWTSPLLASLLGGIALVAFLAEWFLRRSRGER